MLGAVGQPVNSPLRDGLLPPSHNAPVTTSLPPDDASRSESHFAWRQWGPFSLYPRVSGQAVYDDNVTISSTKKTDDLTWNLSPALLVEMGDREGGTGRILTLDYTPRIQIFTENDQFNTVDHLVNLAGRWPFSRLTLGFIQSYDDSSGAAVDVGTRVKRYSYQTGLTSHYEIDEKASFDVNARQTILEYDENLIGSYEVSNDDWFNYQLSSKITGGLGATFGYLEPADSSGQTYERALLRLQYPASARINLSASGGVEVRQYGHGVPQQVGPIFSLGGVYSPRDGTTFQLSGDVGNQNSAALAGQNYTTTTVSLSAQQQFLSRFTASLMGSYGLSDYTAAVEGVQANRQDHFYTVRAAIDTTITPRWAVGVFYMYRKNEQTGQGNYGFQNNQIGLHSSYSF